MLPSATDSDLEKLLQRGHARSICGQLLVQSLRLGHCLLRAQVVQWQRRKVLHESTCSLCSMLLLRPTLGPKAQTLRHQAT